jgi:HPt (histidine-containing phosphotransfer) domain-containing protein
MSGTHPDLFSESELRTFASDICAGDEDLFVELLGDCRNDLRSQFGNLQRSRKEKNWRDFNRAAHTLKSTARTFGSPRLKQMAFDLEAQSEGGVEEADLPLLDERIRALEATSKEFENLLARIAQSPQPYLG